MIWILYIFLFFLVFLFSLLIPRIRLSVEHNPERSLARVSWLWLFFEYNLRTNQTRTRLFFTESTRSDKPEVPPSPHAPSSTTDESVDTPPGKQSKTKSTKFKFTRETSSGKEGEKKTRKFGLKDVYRERKLLSVVKKSIVRFIKRVFKSTRFDRMKFDLVLATGDAFLTGWIYGIYRAILPAVPYTISVNITPDFDDDKPALDLSCAISFRPIVMLFHFLLLLITLPWIRLYKLRRRIRRI